MGDDPSMSVSVGFLWAISTDYAAYDNCRGCIGWPLIAYNTKRQKASSKKLYFVFAFCYLYCIFR